MTTYSLTALLKIREHKKTSAEQNLREALNQHAAEQEKLKQIETSLQNTIMARATLQNKFFIKARSLPSNKREVICHISTSRKNICDENQLRKCLLEQQELVRCAAIKLEIAKNSVMVAHKNLKVIEKHHSAWQQRIRRAEEIKEEYESDDRNGLNYIIKKA